MAEQVSVPKGQEPKQEINDLITREKSEWNFVLGIEKTQLGPLPRSLLNPEVRKNLTRIRLRLISLPVLDLVPKALERYTPDVYLQILNRLYPNWKPYELLDVKERRNPSVVRNLERWYWQMVKDGRIDFPKLPSWIAIESFAEPELSGKNQYPESAIARSLGHPKRLGRPGISLFQAIKQTETETLAKIGLSPMEADLRLLSALEENLLGNRWNLGRTELTSTVYRPSLGEPQLIAVGGFEQGGVAHAFPVNPKFGRPDIGYRPIIVFK